MRFFTLRRHPKKNLVQLIDSIKLDVVGHHGKEHAALIIEGPSSLRINKTVFTDSSLNTAISAAPRGGSEFGNKTGNTVFWLMHAGLDHNNQFTLDLAAPTTDALVLLLEQPGFHPFLDGLAQTISEVRWNEEGELCHSRLLRIQRNSIIGVFQHAYLWDGTYLETTDPPA